MPHAPDYLTKSSEALERLLVKIIAPVAWHNDEKNEAKSA
jgi:hypothetical protein